jgi:hypothetical protein
MKPTKKQRHKIYIEAKEILIKNSEFGMCLCLAISYEKYLNKRGMFNVSVMYSELLDLFPEFKAIKPENKIIGEYWFNNKKQRLVAFNKMIEKTKSNDGKV